jgi:plastocyanin
MTPRSLLVLAPAAVLAAALAVPVTAAPHRETKDATVNVVNFAFQPANPKITLGGSVTWTFTSGTHTATDTSGLALYNHSSNFSFTFTAAGSYSYRCNIHPAVMTGSVNVPMKLKPKKGGVGTSYTVTWATSAALGPFDVQIKRPGSATFVPFLTGTAATSATFHPDAGTGTYLFQAKPHAGPASVFSPAKGIKVS